MKQSVDATPLITLSPRLESIAGLIRDGERVIDVGTDHAWLPLALSQRGRVARVIGSDCAPAALEGARRHVAAMGVEGVELRLGKGLEVLEPGEVDTVVLAGMGRHTMQEILAAASLERLGVQHVIVQPNTDVVGLRAWLMARWTLTEERLAMAKGRYYVTMRARCLADGRGYSAIERLVGPDLMRQATPLTCAYLEDCLARARVRRRGLQRAQRRDDDAWVEVTRRTTLLTAALNRLQRQRVEGCKGREMVDKDRSAD